MEIKGLTDTIDWYDKNAEQYSGTAGKITFEEGAANFLSKLPPDPIVLDAGCGDGRDAQTLTELGAKVTGIDLSEGLLGVARKRAIEAEFVHGSFLDLPFPEESFDGIWSQASLVHLETVEDVQRALSEFARVLKHNGRMHLLVKEQTGSDKTAVVTDSLSNHDRFFRYYERNELSSLLLQAGFTIDEISHEADVHNRPEVSWLRFLAHKS